MSGRRRCVNLDWLEVHVYEPLTEPRTADYFRSVGFVVHEREYGTRVYRSMFTLEDTNGQPFIEVRRDPKSTGDIGIHQINECHLRLHNRACYYDNAADLMAQFIVRYGYEFMRISRVDVCLDFERFDFGDLPAKFVERYLKHRYAKINQANIHAHGADEWAGQSWNSLSWGVQTSQVSTKLYNKTIQLAQVKDKPYIRWSWYESGLVDEPIHCTKTKADGTTYTPDIWRVEFSVRSSVKRWFVIEQNGKRKDFRSIRNTLEMWTGRDNLWKMWASLAHHYFHFKKYRPNVRKDRCEDKLLFDLSSESEFYKIEKLPSIVPQSTELERLMRKLEDYRLRHYDDKLREAIDIIIKAIKDEQVVSDVGDIFSWAEIQAIRQTFALKQKYPSLDPARTMKLLYEAALHPDEHFGED